MSMLQTCFTPGKSGFTEVTVAYFTTGGGSGTNPNSGPHPKADFDSGLYFDAAGRYVLTFDGPAAVEAHMFGGGGGNATSGPGNKAGGGGGYTYGTFTVDSPNQITCYVGGGGSANIGGYMGGGTGNPATAYGTGGGGFTAIGAGDIPHANRQSGPTQYLMIAGGGGGGVAWAATRSTVRPNTPSNPLDGAGGGGGHNPGHPGIYYYPSDGANSIGGCGTLSAGGAGGTGGRLSPNGTAGSKYTGGPGPGGSGGGGYYGGGAGDGYYGYGGGGSGYVSPVVTSSGGVTGQRGNALDPNSIRPAGPATFQVSGEPVKPGGIYIKTGIPPTPPTPSGITAGGGTTYEPGNGYKYHVFNSPGTFTVTSGSGTVDTLIVGGGGGAGPGYNSGAGGGGVVHHSQFPVSAQAYPIAVGSGGASPNANGGDSTFGGMTAKGGGGGTNYNNPTDSNPGGSGGGAEGTETNPAGTATQPAQNLPFTPSPYFNQYGNPGGSGTTAGAYSAAGGGGAGAAGSPAGPGPGAGGIGGAGIAMPGFEYNLVGLSPLIPIANSPSNDHYGAGGGGWGYSTQNSGNRPTGGGGKGGYIPGSPGADQDGLDGVGAGAGNMYYVASPNTGGDGIVIIRYIP